MSLENYEPVAVRLERLLRTLREAGETPRVVTVMLSTPGADTCVFRAELWIGDALVATGHAEEVRGQGNVNRTSHVENCETSSVGRMCENYAPTPDLNKRPSREEMQKVQRYGGDRPAPQAGPGEASPAQLGKIRALSKSLGTPPPAGYESLSKRAASELIEVLITRSKDTGEDPF
jgi:hypothetical protein